MATEALALRPAGLDNDRFVRFQCGHSMEDIALDDGVTLAVVQASIETAARDDQIRKQRELVDLRMTAQIENEKIRKRTRNKFALEAEIALGLLLKGERTVVQKNKETGELSEFTYTDVDTVAVGLEHYRKSISLEEKPATGTVVNVQANTQNIIGGGMNGGRQMTFEERIQQIRQKQREAQAGLIPVPEEESEAIEPEVILGEAIVEERPPGIEDDQWAI